MVFCLSGRSFYIICIKYLPGVTDYLQVTYKSHNLLYHKWCYVNTYVQKRQAWEKQCRKLVTSLTVSVAFYLERKFISCATVFSILFVCRARSEPGGTRWRTGGEVKGKLANGVGSQCSPATSERGLSSITQAEARTPRLPAVDWTGAPTDLNGLVFFGERRTLVSARVPSRSARAIHVYVIYTYTLTYTY